MKKILFWVLVLVLFLSLGLYFIQTKLLFYPEVLPANYDFEYTAEEIFISMTDGIELHGLHFKAEEPAGLILYFHGNAGSLRSWGGVCNQFIALNYNCLIVDYRGYGKSQGKIKNKAQFLADAETVYQYAKETAGELPLSLYGRSVGTIVASYLAGQHEFTHVILENSPWSLGQVAKDAFPFLPIKLFFRFDFENYTYLKTNTNKTLLIHGTSDEVIPYHHFEVLQKEYKSKENYTFVSIEDGGHNNLEEFREYHTAIESFLE